MGPGLVEHLKEEGEPEQAEAAVHATMATYLVDLTIGMPPLVLIAYRKSSRSRCSVLPPPAARSISRDQTPQHRAAAEEASPSGG